VGTADRVQGQQHFASVKLWNTAADGTIVADAVRVLEVGTVERSTHNSPRRVAEATTWAM